MKKLIYFTFILILSYSCGEYQKALNSDEVAVKFNLGTELYDAEKYSKASRLFAQILPQYRGKPQAQKLTYMQAMCFYNTKDYNSSSYQMERFVNSYPDSEKVEEMAFLGAKSYYLMAPIYSKDSDDTKIAIDKLQLFINAFPDSEFIEDANNLIFEQNTPQTRARFVAEVTPQLATIQAQQGIDQFKVIMDSTNNSSLDIESNRLNGRIVLVPTRAVEFIAIDFIITNSGVSFE